MNPFTLIGFFLVLFCGTAYVNASPRFTRDAANSAAVAESTTDLLNNEERLNTLLYKTAEDTSISSENANLSQTIVETTTTTRKPQNAEESKPRRRRRPRHRRPSSSRPDCRTTTTPKPTTTKPTKVYVQFPGLFISHSWGPGR